MTRCLLLLRHGKSAWPDGVEDFERPLTERGQETALRLGAFLAEERLVPDLALVSPARRTRETWSLVERALGERPMRAEPRIYEAPDSRLLAVVREVGPEIGTLLMIGHNPGLQDLLRSLTAPSDRYAHARVVDKYPPAGLAVLDLPVTTWREVSPRSGHLERFVTPKTLGLGEDE